MHTFGCLHTFWWVTSWIDSVAINMLICWGRNVHANMSSLSREFLVEWEAGMFISPYCFRHPEGGTHPLPTDFDQYSRLLLWPPGWSSKPTVPLPTAPGVEKTVLSLLFVAPHYTIAAQPVFRVELIGRFWSVTRVGMLYRLPLSSRLLCVQYIGFKRTSHKLTITTSKTEWNKSQNSDYELRKTRQRPFNKE